MIICHPYQLIFIKTAKTAGTSFEIALSKYCGPNDVITPIMAEDEETRRDLGCRTAQNYLKRRRRIDVTRWRTGFLRTDDVPDFWNHMTAREIRRRVPRDVWHAYTKVSIVQNPFEKIVSQYFFDTRRKNLPFKSYVKKRKDKIRQNKEITHINGQPAVDLMMRYERIFEDIVALQRRVGLPDDFAETFQGLSAKGNIRPPHTSSAHMFDGFDSGVRLINRLCKDEIEAFGYAPK